MTVASEWRYFPELLRNLERVAEGAPCGLCATPTEAMEGPRATLSWCPRCRVLDVRERVGGARTLGIFSMAAHAPPPTPTPAEAVADDPHVPSEVPRLPRPRRIVSARLG